MTDTVVKSVTTVESVLVCEAGVAWVIQWVLRDVCG